MFKQVECLLNRVGSTCPNKINWPNQGGTVGRRTKAWNLKAHTRHVHEMVDQAMFAKVPTAYLSQFPATAQPNNFRAFFNEFPTIQVIAAFMQSIAF